MNPNRHMFKREYDNKVSNEETEEDFLGPQKKTDAHFPQQDIVYENHYQYQPLPQYFDEHGFSTFNHHNRGYFNDQMTEIEEYQKNNRQLEAREFFQSTNIHPFNPVDPSAMNYYPSQSDSIPFSNQFDLNAYQNQTPLENEESNSNLGYQFYHHQVIKPDITNEGIDRLTPIPFTLPEACFQQGNLDSYNQEIPRKEKDVFSELITLATRTSPIELVNNFQNLNTWPYQNYTSSSQEFSSPNANLYHPRSVEASHCMPHIDYLSQANREKQELRPIIKHGQSIDRVNLKDRIYELCIVQQPSRARMCGFSDKDRRPISPPPILKLIAKSKNGEIIEPNTLSISFLVVTCDICRLNRNEPDDLEDLNIDTPSAQMNTPGMPQINDMISPVQMSNLVGTLTSSATKLYDLDGNLGIYFVFNDISIRSEGTCKLRFMLVDLESPSLHKLNTTSVSKVVQTVETDPFLVYSPKKFPGVVQATPLSICFARQGLKLPIRKSRTDKNGQDESKKINFDKHNQT